MFIQSEHRFKLNYKTPVRTGEQKTLFSVSCTSCSFCASAKCQRNKLLVASYRYWRAVQKQQKMLTTAYIDIKDKFGLL